MQRLLNGATKAGNPVCVVDKNATPTDAEACYLKATDLAQNGQYENAVGEFERALALNPGLDTARLQLGLLLLTMARPDAAVQTWAQLDQLPESSPFRLFKAGLEALIRDEFAASIKWLWLGIAANHTNEPLNHDMRMLIDRISAAAAGGESNKATELPAVRTDFSLYDDSAKDPQ